MKRTYLVGITVYSPSQVRERYAVQAFCEQEAISAVMTMVGAERMARGTTRITCTELTGSLLNE